ncbi:MAG TPA: hypothetical protein PLU16_15305 [Gallionellaceae bacterium]|jgi:hypothetical protein|nr:hypothetical protein [Gallionellaceae bacterium]HQS76571.1 hypothetical protein [Gallionellaceae bacterium]
MNIVLAKIIDSPKLATLMCGMATPFLLMMLSPLLERLYPVLSLIVGSGIFILAGVIGCAITLDHPFRAARTVVIGVFVGIIINIIIFPTINGFERNLFPLEIVAYTLWAAIICFPTAALWKSALTRHSRGTR